MRTQPLIALLTLLASASAQKPSPKRGLVYVPSAKYPLDDHFWIAASSDLTWYYNYGSQPSAAFDNGTKLEFVPMLWGAPSSPSDNTFLNDVTNLIKGGTNISYVLTFNEPDGQSNGGSNVDPQLAAQTWMREVEPLKKMGVKLGAPAVTGSPGGFTWLQAFFTACAGKCSADFIPVHWYGNFEGLASHVGQVNGTYPNMTMWITEYADSNDPSLASTQKFYNQSSEYFDRLNYITHYSYFGAFRSDVSNVGPNSAFLTQDGQLTDIGSWYLGGTATGKVPKGAAGRNSVFVGASLVVALMSVWSLV